MRRSEAFLAQTEKPASEFGFLDEYQARKQGVVQWLPRMEDYLNRPETQAGAGFIVMVPDLRNSDFIDEEFNSRGQ